MWHYVEDYDFYRIEYTLDGYWHKIQLGAFNIRDLNMEVPQAMEYLLRAKINCVPEERIYR